MKKTKILAVLGIVLAMGITACNNSSSNEEPKSEPQQSEQAPASSETAPASSQHVHSWDAGTVTKDPTCTAKGVKTFHCSGCSETKTEDVAALGHAWNAGVETTPATCTAKGVKTFTCTRCQETKTEEIAALGHDWGEWGTAKAATCSEEGSKVRSCKRAGCTAQETDIIAKLPHTFLAENDGWVEVKAPTCVPGKAERECQVCHEKEEKVLPATGAHVWGEWVVSTPATCAKGQEKRVCQNCNIEEFRDIDPTGDHQWGEKETIADVFDNTDPDNPVLVKAGYDKYECEVCHGVRIEIDADKATLMPIVKKDGTPLLDGDKPFMSKWKTESIKINDETVKVGVKLDKYTSSPSSDAAYQGAFKFNFSFDQAADVTVYQYACMDGMGSNDYRTYYDGGDKTNFEYGNFEFDVNGDAIDLYGLRNVQYKDIVERRAEDDPYRTTDNKDYSTYGTFLIGESKLVEGDNEFVYKRLGSYNLILKTIILEVTFPGHDHEAAADAEWVNTNADFHWKNCKEGDGHRVLQGRHEFGERYIERTATCLEKGLAHRDCKVCGYVQDIDIPVLAHDYSVKLADNAAGAEGAYIATETMACANNCGETAIKWAAKDYDVTATTERSDENKLPVSRDNGNAIDFDNSVCQNDNKDYTKKGTHIVYKINLSTDVENVDLAMYATAPSFGADPFNRNSYDQRKGYIKDADDKDVQPESRYGLKVDGKEIMVGKNSSGSKGKAWYVFPGISLTLEAGVHDIEFFKYGGYDVDIYSFMLSGLPAIEGSTFTLGDWVTTDDSVHYKECADKAGVKFCSAAHEWVSDPDHPNVAPTCAEKGINYKKCAVCGKLAQDEVAALGHDWDEVVADTPATCTAEGTGHRECKRCHNVEENVTIEKLAHNYVETKSKNSDGKDVTTSECSNCHDKVRGIKVSDGTITGKVGSDGKMDNGTVVKWKMPVAAGEAGQVTILISIKMSSDSHSSQNFDPTKYTVKVNGTEQTFLIESGKTYGGIGLTTSTKYFAIANYTITDADITAGEIEIEFDHNNSSYRLLFTGEIRVQF